MANALQKWPKRFMATLAILLSGILSYSSKNQLANTWIRCSASHS